MAAVLGFIGEKSKTDPCEIVKAQRCDKANLASGTKFMLCDVFLYGLVYAFFFFEDCIN
jgi:hypothetical protein